MKNTYVNFNELNFDEVQKIDGGSIIVGTAIGTHIGRNHPTAAIVGAGAVTGAMGGAKAGGPAGAVAGGMAGANVGFSLAGNLGFR